MCQLTITTTPSRTVCRLGLATINLCAKFEVSSFTNYEDMNSDEKCQNWGSLGGQGLPKVTGNITIRQNLYNFLFDFNRNYVSILYCFRVIVSYSSKVADFSLPHQRLAPPNFTVIFVTRKLESPWDIVWHYLRDPTFSRFHTIPECDRHTRTDRQTDRYTTTACIASRGKNRPQAYCTAYKV